MGGYDGEGEGDMVEHESREYQMSSDEESNYDENLLGEDDNTTLQVRDDVDSDESDV